jgi:magnesium transporter
MSRKRKRRSIGLAPGSLIFTGERQLSYSNITLTTFTPEDIQEVQVRDQLPGPAGEGWINWYDLRGLHNVALVEAMGRTFKIHPLVLEDILDTNQRPKFEEYENGIFITIQDYQFNKETFEVKKEQVTVYVQQNVVFSFQEDDEDLFTSIRERLKNAHNKVRKRGSDYLAYALVDSIVDNYFVILDQIEEKLDALEADILMHPDQSVKSKIHELKLSTLALRRAISAIKVAVGDFSRSDHGLIAENTEVFLRDLHDHTIQILENTEAFRDLIQGLYDLYLSEISLKMNNVMQVLTIISTIFIPLSFLAGVYGMNFHHMPELQWKYSYYVLLGVMFFIFLGSLFYFRRKRWL